MEYRLIVRQNVS